MFNKQMEREFQDLQDRFLQARIDRDIQRADRERGFPLPKVPDDQKPALPDGSWPTTSVRSK